MDKFSLKTVHLKMSSVRCQPFCWSLIFRHLHQGCPWLPWTDPPSPVEYFCDIVAPHEEASLNPASAKDVEYVKITDFWQYQISNLFLQAPLDEQRCGQVHGGAHIHHVHAPQICKIYISLCTSVHLKVSSRFWDAGRCTLSSTPWTYR